MIQVDIAVYFLAAFFILTLPLDWLVSAIMASIFHELCHIFTLYAFHGKVEIIKISVSGCVVYTDRIGEIRQFLSILAGPAGSFSLLLLCHTAPKIAICGLFHGAYNMVPVLPLDGGRLLQLLLCRYFPEHAQFLLDMTAIGICMIVAVFGIWLSAGVFRKIWPMIIACVLISRALPRKTPCKPLKF